jgi:hypothetical protein
MTYRRSVHRQVWDAVQQRSRAERLSYAGDTATNRFEITEQTQEAVAVCPSRPALTPAVLPHCGDLGNLTGMPRPTDPTHCRRMKATLNLSADKESPRRSTRPATPHPPDGSTAMATGRYRRVKRDFRRCVHRRTVSPRAYGPCVHFLIGVFRSKLKQLGNLGIARCGIHSPLIAYTPSPF